MTLWQWQWHMMSNCSLFTKSKNKIQKEIKINRRIGVENKKDSDKRRETKRDKSTVFDSDSGSFSWFSGWDL